MACALDIVVTAAPQHRSYLPPPPAVDVMARPGVRSLVLCTERDWCICGQGAAAAASPCAHALQEACRRDVDAPVRQHLCPAADVIVRSATGGALCVAGDDLDMRQPLCSAGANRLPLDRVLTWLSRAARNGDQPMVVITQDAMRQMFGGLFIIRDQVRTQLRPLAAACQARHARLVLCAHRPRDAADILQELC